MLYPAASITLKSKNRRKTVFLKKSDLVCWVAQPITPLIRWHWGISAILSPNLDALWSRFNISVLSSIENEDVESAPEGIKVTMDFWSIKDRPEVHGNFDALRSRFDIFVLNRAENINVKSAPEGIKI